MVLDAVLSARCFAKIRTGGVKPEAIPPVEDVGGVHPRLRRAAARVQGDGRAAPPVRAMQPLTYDADAPRAMMHGFLNVFLAAAFAWHGERDIEPILAETDPTAFRFDDRAHWRDRSLDCRAGPRRADELRPFVRLVLVRGTGPDLEALGLL